MEAYLIYIAKASIATVVFYLAFLLLFQNRKQFVFNRIFLPVSFLISYLIPLNFHSHNQNGRNDQF